MQVDAIYTRDIKDNTKNEGSKPMGYGRAGGLQRIFLYFVL